MQFLFGEQIPDFVSILSKTAEQNNVQITQSAATLQTIVDILFKIANVSQTITIDEPVIKVCIFRLYNIVYFFTFMLVFHHPYASYRVFSYSLS